MKMPLQIEVNSALYLRNPETSDLGRKIIEHAIRLIYKNGFEDFTFKKLASEIGTTEAGVYRYFENKHKLLIYLVSWYWSWLQFQITIETNNIKDPMIKLKRIINLLAATIEDDKTTGHINESILHQIVIAEGSKAYLTKHVGKHNKQHLFKPYKDLCASIGDVILTCNPKYKYPKSLASTIVEMAHFQNYFMHHLPSLTDFGKTKQDTDVVSFLNDLIVTAVRAK